MQLNVHISYQLVAGINVMQHVVAVLKKEQLHVKDQMV
jgi:uncharacterized protein YdcH (DUF465 family)